MPKEPQDILLAAEFGGDGMEEVGEGGVTVVPGGETPEPEAEAGHQCCGGCAAGGGCRGGNKDA